MADGGPVEGLGQQQLLVWNTQEGFAAMWIRGEDYSMTDEGYNYVMLKATTTVRDDESYNYMTNRATTT